MKRNVLISVVILCSLSVNAQNLLVNPGFETWASGKPSGWSISNTVNVSQNTTNYTEGTKSCKSDIQSTNISFNISQNIAVTAGKTYSFRVSYFIERGDGTDARISSYFNNAANKAIAMSLEDSLALKGPGGNNAYFTTELGVWKTYSCDIVAPVGATVFVFYVRNAAYSNVSWDNFSFSVNTLPTLYVSKTELSGFYYTPGNGPSSEKSFVVKGSNLTGSTTVTAPLNYEISTLSGVSFDPKNTLTIPQINGLANSVTIYVRLKSGLPANNYSGNISVATTGVTSKNVLISGSVGSPPIVINSSLTSLSGFTYSEGVGPSAVKSFTVSGTGLLGGVTISAPDNYEISIFGGLNFLGSNMFTISQSGGNVALTTIYVRMKVGLTAATYFGNINLSTSGGTTKTVALTGAVNSIPELSISTTTLTNFRYEPGKGPSAEQSFTVSGKGMTIALIITAPVDYEISTETGINFIGTSQLVLTQSGGLVNSTPIYVRLKTGLSETVHSGNLNLQTSGGITKTISLTGIVSSPLELTVSTDVLTGLNYEKGSGPSSEKVFTLSAKGLSSMLIVSAPVNFEISTETGGAFTGNNQLILPLTAGNVAITTIYVRLKAGLSAADYSGNLTLSSGTEITKNIALSGSVTALSEMTVSTSFIGGLNYWVGSGPSSQQSLTVSAKGLVSDLTITAPAGFELSTGQGVNFSGLNKVVLPASNGQVPFTTIYVRLVTNLLVNTYSGDIELSATALAPKYITLKGNVLLTTDISNAAANLEKVYSNSTNIVVQGVGKHQTVDLFSLSGKLLQTVKSTGETLEFSVHKGSVYIVKINSEIYKVLF